MASILSKIIDQIEIEIKKIKTANGYNTNISDNSFFRRPSKWRASKLFPCVVITYFDGANKLQPGRHTRRRQRLRLMFYLRSNETPIIEQIADLQEDLDNVVAGNPKLTTASNEELVVYWKANTDKSTRGLIDPFEIWVVDLEMVYHERH